MASVCVIGGGIGGLAVAARLAAKRHQVTLFEASDQVGGQVRSISHEGFTFDTGPSFLALPAVFRDLFLKTGRPLEDEVDLRELEPGQTYVFADGSRLALPGGSSGRTAAAVGRQLGAEAGDEWRDFTRTAGDLWQRIRSSVLTEPISDPEQVLRSLPAPSRRRRPARRPTLLRSARDLFNDARLQHVITSYAGLVGTDPRDAPPSLLTWPFIEQAFGLWEIPGGLSQLSDAIRARCESVGVDVRVGTPITRIESDGHGVTGVRAADGSRWLADVVVSDIDATHLYADLVPENPDPGIPSAHPSDSKFLVLLGLKGRQENPERHLTWLPRRPLDEARELGRGRPTTDPTIRVTRYPYDRMAPTDHEAVRLVVSAPRHGRGAREHEWTRERGEEYAQHLIDTLARRGLDLRDRVVSMRAHSPADFAAGLQAPQGSLDGAALRAQRWLLDRPGNISPLPGLYLVGGSTHPGPGLPFAGQSAETVAEAIGRADR